MKCELKLSREAYANSARVTDHKAVRDLYEAASLLEDTAEPPSLFVPFLPLPQLRQLFVYNRHTEEWGQAGVARVAPSCSAAPTVQPPDRGRD